MLRINKLTDYASIILSCMACTPELSVSAGILAERTQLPFATVSKVLKLLTNAGLLISTRGTNGGYILAKAPALITIPNIVEAIEGPITLTECSQSKGACPHEKGCSVMAPWRYVNDQVVATLSGITLHDLLTHSKWASYARR